MRVSTDSVIHVRNVQFARKYNYSVRGPRWAPPDYLLATLESCQTKTKSLAVSGDDWLLKVIEVPFQLIVSTPPPMLVTKLLKLPAP